MYLKGAQTIPDAVENLRKGIALGGLDTFSSIPRTVQDASKHITSIMAMKEKRTQFTTEDTLTAVKESIHDSMYANNKALVKLLDNIGERLANIVEHFQRRQSSRNRTEIDHTSEVEIVQEMNTGIETEIDMMVEIDIEVEIELT